MATTGYLSEDTIAALSTPVGGALAMVRVSGPLAIAVLSRLAPSVGLEPEGSSRGACADR